MEHEFMGFFSKTRRRRVVSLSTIAGQPRSIIANRAGARAARAAPAQGEAARVDSTFSRPPRQTRPAFHFGARISQKWKQSVSKKNERLSPVGSWRRSPTSDVAIEEVNRC
ncbi:hypothetical protein [uncultured Albimonas sp.]|uniref:hypothetical protein n=1 Tax=uncultured Albimonas sp. TaxID=1331701 RepID=UPI0030EFA5C2|tara:strand:- start:1664 stop:1996 length:333 start_codon:yes stop_codon:yes gene_type:complete